jgi:hypothetical protein
LTEEDCTIPESIELTPLPCWEHLPKEEYRSRVREMIEDIARETRERHRAEGTRPLGVEKIRRRPALPPDPPGLLAGAEVPLRVEGGEGAVLGGASRVRRRVPLRRREAEGR